MTDVMLAMTPRDLLADPSGHPLKFEVLQQDRYHRWLPPVKVLFALPYALLLAVFAVLLLPLYVASAVVVAVTGSYPRTIFTVASCWLLWSLRLLAYVCLLTDAYPTFSVQGRAWHRVRFRLDYPFQGRVARWRPFVAWMLVLGQVLVLPVVYASLALMVALAFFSILFTQTLPPGVFDFVVRALQFNARIIVYCLFMTERYPGFSL